MCSARSCSCTNNCTRGNRSANRNHDTSVERIEINEDGSLTVKVYAKVASEEIPVDAKVTLAKDGVVIESVQTENGSFSFANIAPGAYQTVTYGSGGGGVSSGGGFGGGRLLGRRFGRRGLLCAGLIGGVVAIAVP